MRRSMSIILIAMILTSQGLCSFHAHLGMALSHSESHSGRPHFHVHGSHSHGSHEDSANNHHDGAPVLPAVSRLQFPLDASNACYFADSVVSMIQRSSAAEKLNFVVLELDVNAADFVHVEVLTALDYWPDAPCQWSNARIPLYLRDLSIRC